MMPWDVAPCGSGASGVVDALEALRNWEEEVPSVSVQEFHRQFQMQTKRDTAVSSLSSASTFGEVERWDSDSGSSESGGCLALRPPPGLECVAAPELAPSAQSFGDSNPLLQGLQQTVMQMIDLKYQQRAAPSPAPLPVEAESPAAPAVQPKVANQSVYSSFLGSRPEPESTAQRPWKPSRRGGTGRKPWDTRPRPPRASRSKAVAMENYKFGFTVIFQGYDQVKHHAFELPQRLIGRDGCNMKDIYQNKPVAARVTGIEGLNLVQLSVNCQTEELLKEARMKVDKLLTNLTCHWRKYCRAAQTPCPDLFFISEETAADM